MPAVSRAGFPYFKSIYSDVRHRIARRRHRLSVALKFLLEIRASTELVRSLTVG
ncbi:hypothetical protein [Nostoc sp.]|uniref:hypothetical protein n=1 Tax=Nostoc sp. TaxID=1180 RepID=UPI002FF66A53